VSSGIVTRRACLPTESLRCLHERAGGHRVCFHAVSAGRVDGAEGHRQGMEEEESTSQC